MDLSLRAYLQGWRFVFLKCVRLGCARPGGGGEGARASRSDERAPTPARHPPTPLQGRHLRQRAAVVLRRVPQAAAPVELRADAGARGAPSAPPPTATAPTQTAACGPSLSGPPPLPPVAAVALRHRRGVGLRPELGPEAVSAGCAAAARALPLAPRLPSRPSRARQCTSSARGCSPPTSSVSSSTAGWRAPARGPASALPPRLTSGPATLSFCPRLPCPSPPPPGGGALQVPVSLLVPGVRLPFWALVYVPLFITASTVAFTRGGWAMAVARAEPSLRAAAAAADPPSFNFFRRLSSTRTACPPSSCGPR